MTFSKGKSLFFSILILTPLKLLTAETQFVAPLSDNDKAGRIVKQMELIYLKPEMKSPYDKVQLNAGTLSVSIWRDLPPDPQAEKIECTGYQWLLTGRGEHMGEGAKTVFQKFPDLRAIQLEFVELTTKSKPLDGKGKLQKEMIPKTYMKMVADREPLLASKTGEADLKKLLRKDTTTCVKVGRELISKREVTL